MLNKMDFEVYNETDLMQEIFSYDSCLNETAEFQEGNKDEDIFSFTQNGVVPPSYEGFNEKSDFTPDSSISDSDTMDFETAVYRRDDDFLPLENYPVKLESQYSSTDEIDSEEDLYNMFLSQPLKTEIKLPDSPPVTPPQTTPPREESPPHSPVVSQTITKVHSNQPKFISIKRNAPLVPKLGPIKVVTISTAANTTSAPLNIQPKLHTGTIQVKSITNPVPVIIKTNPTKISVKTEPSCVINTKPLKNTIVIPPKLTSGTTPRVVSHMPPIAPAINPCLKYNTEDVRALKRQQRMIKNRESASLSRKKKKEHLMNVESQNAFLLEENERLRSRIAVLEKENTLLRRSTVKKNSTVLLGLTLFFVFNLWSIIPGIGFGRELLPTHDASSSDLSLPKSLTKEYANVPSAGGRHLLWYDPTDNEESISNSNHSSMCPLYINATESIRIENELRGWFETKDSQKPHEVEYTRFHPKTRASRQEALRLRSSRKKEIEVQSNALTSVTPKFTEHQSTFYQNIFSDQTDSQDSVVQRLLSAIEQQNDTYYVLSLSHDHVLLPALSTNSSARPKMSLIMPPNPNSINESYPEANQLHLVQIDCQVMSTRLVQIKDTNPIAPKSNSIITRTTNVTKGFQPKRRKRKHY